MNKRALEDYALFARRELENQITLSLNKLGIYEDRVLKANIVGDFTVIEGSQETFPKRVYALRESILTNLKLEERKFSSAVEEYAYTWFNRIVAIRFMEVHDYFDHGFKVLTSSDGSYEPDILKNAHYLIDELNLDSEVILSLKEQNKIEELYRYLLFKQCNALNSILPEMFDNEASYMELLLPNNLLSQDSIIRKIEIIPEEDFKNDVEVVGWLYQFYNKTKKDEINSSKKKINKDTLPAVTQLFTPDWIVRYMAENSVGRIWLESNPNSSLKNDMKYYVDDAEQGNDVINKLEKIRYKNINPEDIKIIEPCCGSGHILVYVFDLLYKMYKDSSCEEKDIPGLILKHNLFGLDVDKRASQLAKFALIMKARSIDGKFFNSNRFVKPRVFEIIDSSVLLETNYKENMQSLHFMNESIKITDYLVDTFKNAKTIGSLLKIKAYDYASVLDDINRCRKNETPNLMEQSFFEYGLDSLKKILLIAVTLARKYDVIITNPPYRPISDFEEPVKKYAIEYYYETRNDLYSMFMELDCIKQNGFKAIINLQNWMTGYSYIDYRKNNLNSMCFVNALHLGARAFEDFGGEVVQNIAFISRNTKLDLNIKFFDLRNGIAKEKEISFLDKIKNNDFIVKKASDFKKMPSNEYAYWASDNVLNAFGTKVFLNQVGEAKSGVMTGKDEVFLRCWYEVDKHNISFESNHENYKKMFLEKKWFPVTNGGITRKWYGNLQMVVNMKNHGYEISHYGGNTYRLRDENYYFKNACSWSTISSNNLAVRLTPENVLFGNNGPTYFTDNLLYAMGFLNTKVSNYMCNMLNPTLSILIDDIEHLPIIVKDKDYIENLVRDNIEISKWEWNLHEVSWDFKRNYLIGSGKIEDKYDEFISVFNEKKQRMLKNENELNDYFISLYKLSDELNSYVSEDELTIKSPSKNNAMKELISYLIGIKMGRYSLDEEGLIFAGGDSNSLVKNQFADDDGIIPLYSFIGIAQDLSTCICDLIKKIYGDTYYDDNLNFVANCLGRKNNEGSEEAINRYLNDEFYNWHLQDYKSRTSGSKPIYWMLSSGKQGAFKCLIYIHRYTKNTLAAINSKYFLPCTAMYKAERERLEFKLQTADVRDKKKLEQELQRIEACEQELLEYGQVLDHVANQCLNGEITIDLDDGVKNNYVKFQNISLEVNGATIKKNLLVPFGLESEKKKK